MSIDKNEKFNYDKDCDSFNRYMQETGIVYDEEFIDEEEFIDVDLDVLAELLEKYDTDEFTPYIIDRMRI